MWLCQTCNHIHLGEQAPERCPVCGVDSKHFDEIREAQDLSNSQTLENLKKAFAGESQANRRYLAFATIAEKENLTDAKEAFLKAANDETAHAHAHLAYLLLGTKESHNTLANLETAIAGESYENDIMYPEFAAIAEKEGYPTLARYFRSVARHEKEHAKRFQTILDELRRNDS